MLKTLLLGVWVSLVVAGSAVGVGLFAMQPDKVPQAAEKVIEYRKMNAVSVPKIADGAMQGYVVARLGLTLDAELAKRQPIAPEILIAQDAFRILYSDVRLDFRDLKAYDIAGLTKALTENANKRMQAEVVLGVAVEDLNYFTSAEVNK